MPIQRYKITKYITLLGLTILIVSLSSSVLAADDTGTKCDKINDKICVELLEPLEDVEILTGISGVDLIKNYISAIYKWAAGLVGIVATLNMVISGIQIMTAADSDRAASAKNRIIQSIVALCILFISGLILYTVNPTFFVQS